ncbi:iron-containing alcohol dehydrogenase [Candidatus Falkowbacteria bacterium]|nr:iron-containing alcohol dehydrogenase [Candidatus Falkowbacteria bacterium]
MTPFAFSTARTVVFRPGAAADLAALAGGLLGARPLLVTDAGIMRLGLVDAALASLRAAGAEVSVFDAV